MRERQHLYPVGSGSVLHALVSAVLEVSVHMQVTSSHAASQSVSQSVVGGAGLSARNEMIVSSCMHICTQQYI